MASTQNNHVTSAASLTPALLALATLGGCSEASGRGAARAHDTRITAVAAHAKATATRIATQRKMRFAKFGFGLQLIRSSIPSTQNLIANTYLVLENH